MLIHDHSKLWEYIKSETAFDKSTSKPVVYSMLFGFNIITMMMNFRLEIEDVLAIRAAFNEFVTGKFPDRVASIWVPIRESKS